MLLWWEVEFGSIAGVTGYRAQLHYQNGDAGDILNRTIEAMQEIELNYASVMGVGARPLY